MKKYIPHIISIITITSNIAFSQTPVDLQSSARPFGLDIVAPVSEAASDSASTDFQLNSLPGMLDFVRTNLNERQSLDDVSGVALDPEALKIHTDSEVRVYFVGEGAGYLNTLGISTDVSAISPENSKILFPNSNSFNRYYTSGNGYRTDYYPLIPGDFVDLGTYESGTSLDFFLIADGANGGERTYAADDTSNHDGIQHVVSFALPGSPYLIIGFEDLYNGGDRDYNDLVFAVDIGATNVNYLANPEPSTIAMAILMMGLSGFIYLKRSRKHK